MALDGVDLVPLAPTGCRACGKGHVWKRIVINGLDAEQARVAAFLGRGALPVA